MKRDDLPNPGDCVRCDRRELPARTRGGLCWWCAKKDPTLPGWTISLRGSVSREDLIALRSTAKRITRGRGGRPRELTWEQVCDAYDLLRSPHAPKPTEEQVAEYLGFDPRTVQHRAQDNGGWPPKR